MLIFEGWLIAVFVDHRHMGASVGEVCNASERVTVMVLVVTVAGYAQGGEGQHPFPIQHLRCDYNQKQNKRQLLKHQLWFYFRLIYNTMIQIPPEPDYPTPQYATPIPSNPYILRRIIYTIVLTSILLLMCFYLELLVNYDLLSMLLGFLVCIILQFIILWQVFKEERQKLQMDEIGVINHEIQTMFGELDPKEQEKKNRQKYYRREMSEEDRLFKESNDRIYQNVMTYLRGKEEPNFSQQISKIKAKWYSLEHKIKLIEDFLDCMLKLAQNRKNIYAKYKNRIKRVHDTEEYVDWSNFLSNRLEENVLNRKESANNTSFHSVDAQAFGGTGGTPFDDSNILPEYELMESILQANLSSNWGILNTLMLQKIKLAQKSVLDIKQRIIEEFISFAKTVRQAGAASIKKRQQLTNDYKLSLVQKQKNLLQLQKIAEEITKLAESLTNNAVDKGQIQKILEKQFKQRMLKIQSQNLLIKLSRATNNSLSNGELLFHELEEEKKELERYLDIFNRKINQYLHQMAGFGEQKAPVVRKHLKEAVQRPIHQDQLTPQMDAQQLYRKILERRSKESSFKNYLQNLVRQFEELKGGHSKERIAIRQQKQEMQRKQSIDWLKDPQSRTGVTTGVRVLYFASTVNDQKLTRLFQELSSIQETHNERMRLVVVKQLEIVKKYETQVGSLFNKKLMSQYELYKRKQDQLFRSHKRQGKNEGESNDSLQAQLDSTRQQLIVIILQYAEEGKIKNILPQIVAIMVQLEEEYSRLASQIDFQEANQQNDRINDPLERKKQKFFGFSHYLYKRGDEPIIDDELSNKNIHEFGQVDDSRFKYLIDFQDTLGSGEQRTTKGKQNKFSQFFKYRAGNTQSRMMINRVLCVLFNQWSRSEYFHEVIKDQLLVSLNRKKPDIVEHLRIDFFRIIEREKDLTPIEHIRAHPSQIYRCMLDFHLNFRGKIAVKIGSRLKIGNKPELTIKLMIKQFKVPIRLCFTPFSLGKCYASLLDKPKLTIDFNVKVGRLELTKIPLFTFLIKTYAVMKLRKKFLWPKRMTLNLPLTYKSPLELAIEQRINFQKQQERLGKKSK